jgi:hypothetical protein
MAMEPDPIALQSMIRKEQNPEKPSRTRCRITRCRMETGFHLSPTSAECVRWAIMLKPMLKP